MTRYLRRLRNLFRPKPLFWKPLGYKVIAMHMINAQPRGWK